MLHQLCEKGVQDSSAQLSLAQDRNLEQTEASFEFYICWDGRVKERVDEKQKDGRKERKNL